MALKSSLQCALESVGVPVKGIVGIGLGVGVVIHTECLFDIGAMDLDDPAAFLGEGNLFGVVPIEERQRRCLLTQKGREPFEEV